MASVVTPWASKGLLLLLLLLAAAAAAAEL